MIVLLIIALICSKNAALGPLLTILLVEISLVNAVDDGVCTAAKTLNDWACWSVKPSANLVCDVVEAVSRVFSDMLLSCWLSPVGLASLFVAGDDLSTTEGTW